MVFFRNANREVWQYTKTRNLIRREDFDNVVDFVNKDFECYPLLRDRTFCGLSNVVKIGKTPRSIICLDFKDQLWSYWPQRMELSNVKNFLINGEQVLVEFRNGDTEIHTYGFRNPTKINKKPEQYVGLVINGRVRGFSIADKVLDQQLIVKCIDSPTLLRVDHSQKNDHGASVRDSVVGIDEDGKLKGQNFGEYEQQRAKYIRNSEGVTIVFLEDDSLHSIQSVISGKIILAKISDSPCYPLDHQFASSKSARFFEFN
jgi:hypothetical protein